MKYYYFLAALIFIAILSVTQACALLEPASPDPETLLEGPVLGLSHAENQRFLSGDAAFSQVFTRETGLGPLFVATSCVSCHAGDGKGHPFTTLTRYGQADSTGNLFLAFGGPQQQNRALPGYQPEAIPAGATFAKFTPPSNTGLGFLELVSDADLLSMADPSDANGDGISGVANWKTLPAYIQIFENAVPQNGKYICRFGKKSGAYNLLHQTVNAYNQDMGVNSYYEPFDVYSGFETDAEVSNQTIHDLVFYLQTLKAPEPRNQAEVEVQTGKALFQTIGCGNCHKETLQTGYSPVDALSNKEFHPYTDLLLHDMGPDLDDGYTEGSALSSEWRTAPLWGLGLSPDSQGGSYFLLHDGRATTIDKAIVIHGGEALNSKNNYLQLPATEKQALLKFLESL